MVLVAEVREDDHVWAVWFRTDAELEAYLEHHPEVTLVNKAWWHDSESLALELVK